MTHRIASGTAVLGAMLLGFAIVQAWGSGPVALRSPARAAPAGPRSTVRAPAVDTDHVGFSVKMRGVVTTYSVLGLFVLPAEAVDLEIASPENLKSEFKLLAGASEIPQAAPGRWSWVAPSEKGLYSVRVVPPDGSPEMTLNVFVMLPFSSLRDGKLNGYRIGRYPGHPKNDRPAYQLPRGFIEVTQDVEDVRVSPHFRLKQFLCKQGSGYPKYIILIERLVMKLEMVLTKVRASGLHADGFFVMSGYRTPSYNTSLGNVEFSMHQWGGAADIFIDEKPNDGHMDDLNGDGAIDIKDAKVLQTLVEDMETNELAEPFIGGLGLYGPTASHGPFIHVDVRGFRARW